MNKHAQPAPTGTNMNKPGPARASRNVPVLLNSLNEVVGFELVQNVSEQAAGRALEVLGTHTVAVSTTVHTGQHANTEALAQIQLARNGSCNTPKRQERTAQRILM